MAALVVLALTFLILIPLAVLVVVLDRRAAARRRERVDTERRRVIRDAFAVKAALDAEAFRAHQRLNAAARRSTERR